MPQTGLEQALGAAEHDVVDLHENAGGFVAQKILYAMAAGGAAFATKYAGQSLAGKIGTGALAIGTGAIMAKAAVPTMAGVALGYAAHKSAPVIRRRLQHRINQGMEGLRWLDEKGSGLMKSVSGTASRGQKQAEARQQEIQLCQQKHAQRFISKSECSKLFRNLQAASDEALSKEELFTLAAVHRAGGLPIEKNTVQGCLKQIRRQRRV